MEKDFPVEADIGYAWSGWRSIEERVEGVLSQRRTYGPGPDEMVHLGLNVDLSPGESLETQYYPIYDAAGNLVVLTGPNGERLADTFYSPFGEEQLTRADLSPNSVVGVTVEDGKVVVELQEEGSLQRWVVNEAQGNIVLEVQEVGGGGSALTAGGAGPVGGPASLPGSSTVSTTSQRPVQLGAKARRRIVLTPDTAPVAGTELELVIPAAALADLFFNEPAEDFTVTFPWPATSATPVPLYDAAAPEVDEVLLASCRLEIEFSERIAPATAGAIELDGQPLSWTQLPDGYTLQSVESVPPGPHTLTVSTGLQDLAGTALSAPYSVTFSAVASTTGQSTASGLASTVAATTSPQDQVIDRRPPPSSTTLAALGSLFGFHGRPLDPETGFVYFRNRFFDTELGRFISADPLGYVDGPSQYIFAGWDPVNMSDPLGLYVGYTTSEAAQAAANPPTNGNAAGTTIAPLRFADGYISGAGEWTQELAWTPIVVMQSDPRDLAVIPLHLADSVGELGRMAIHCLAQDLCFRYAKEELEETWEYFTTASAWEIGYKAGRETPEAVGTAYGLTETQQVLRTSRARQLLVAESQLSRETGWIGLRPGDPIPDDLEILVIGSGNKPGSFVLRQGVDDLPLGVVTQPGKSASIATDLTMQTEIPKMFGRAPKNGDLLSGAFVRDIRAAGFEAVYAPTPTNPYHVRIIERSSQFNGEGGGLLSLAFDRVTSGSR